MAYMYPQNSDSFYKRQLSTAIHRNLKPQQNIYIKEIWSEFLDSKDIFAYISGVRYASSAASEKKHLKEIINRTIQYNRS